jgi:hypothetical protein
VICVIKNVDEKLELCIRWGDPSASPSSGGFRKLIASWFKKLVYEKNVRN